MSGSFASLSSDQCELVSETVKDAEFTQRVDASLQVRLNDSVEDGSASEVTFEVAVVVNRGVGASDLLQALSEQITLLLQIALLFQRGR